MGTYLVQKITVMGYNNNRILKVDQELLEPSNRIEIQMVGWLIQKQNIRVAKQSLCQKDFDFQITIKLAHHFVMNICINAKTIQEGCRITLCIPAIHLCKLCFKLRCTDTIFIREVFLRIDCVLFFHNIIQAFISHNNRVEYHILVVFEVILLQNRQTLAIIHDNFTICRFKFSGKNL